MHRRRLHRGNRELRPGTHAQEPGQTLRFAPVPFMAVLWFFKWMLQLYLLNLTKGYICRLRWTSNDQNAFNFRGLRPPDPLTRGSAPGPRWGLCPQTAIIGSCSALAMVPPPITDPFRRLWVQLNFAPVPQIESRRLWLNRVPASVGERAGMSPQSGGR